MVQKTFLVFFTVLFISSAVLAQKIDSLNAVLDTARNDRKVKTLNELFRANLNSDPVKALGYTREALNLATEINDQKGMAASYNNLGIVYRNQGALDKALDYYIMSLRIYESLENKEGIATTKNNISNIYSIKRDYPEAMKYLEESYNLFLVLNDPTKIVGSLNNLGNLNIEIQMYDKAMQYLMQAAEISGEIGMKFSDPLNNIGNIFYKQGNYQRAVEFYEKALVMERDNSNKLGMLNTITNLAITYAKAKQPEPTRLYLDEAASLCNELQAYAFLPAIYRASAQDAANRNNFKEAYEMQLKYDEAREKVYGEESSRKIAQMEMVIDFQEQEKKFDLLRKQNEINKLELRSSRLFILLVIFIVLAVLGGLNFFYINKKKSLKMRKEIAKQKG
ncbi:MAG: tetratricopeptide repeat protein [Cyclobacteriaceae bacterium]|nr:tetratricopeptide repeat protein [Cyclobacteriaceae bacterium]MDH4296973.1 tetratricopeptide repeat protein [Cyclobacteriaceae bacterium]MDH5250454.1 tetratricopeptide repeat protein [Cyclobacteriaceae bacterium]